MYEERRKKHYLRSYNPICPRHPGCKHFCFGKSSGDRQLTCSHGNPTPAPSLWPGRELRKYHYPLHLSSPPPGAARILRISFIARLISRVVAHLRLGSASRPMQVTYLMKWIFSCQRSLSGRSSPLTFLLAGKNHECTKLFLILLKIFFFRLFNVITGTSICCASSRVLTAYSDR